MRRTFEKFERFRDELAKLEALGGILDKSAKKRADKRDGVIELVEVRPGVFAMPTNRPAAIAGLGERASSLLEDAEELCREAEKLTGRPPWRKRSR